MVDVLNSNKAVLHTYPIAIGAPNIIPDETEYRAKAVKAAAHAQLVPNANLKGLTTRMHVGRGGALAPYGDDQDTLSETKQGLDQVVRAPTFFGKRTAVCMAARRDTGTVLMTSVYTSAPTFFGNRRAALKEGLKNNGTRAASATRPDLLDDVNG